MTGRTGQASHGPDIYAFVREVRERVGAVGAADGTNEMHGGARARRGDSLIGALAAFGARQYAAEHCLARGRQHRQAHDQVHVDRADDDHPARAVRRACARHACRKLYRVRP